MDNMLGIVVAMILSALIGAGYYTYESNQITSETDALMAVREAKALVRFTDALNTYVQANQGVISGGNAQSDPLVVTATTMSLPASAGVDALGQALEGVVATPNGSAQSWMVIPAGSGSVSYSTPTGGTAYATTAQMLQKYDLNAPMDAERFWGQVAADIVKISAGKINGYVYNDVNQAFVPSLAGNLVTPGKPSPTSGTGAWDALVHYFPSSGVAYPQTLPAPYAPNQFSIIASSQLSKTVGYWVWALQFYSNWGTNTPQTRMSFFSLGYAPGCPVGGVIPQSFPGAAQGADGNIGMTSTGGDPRAGQSFASNYVCLPMPQSVYSTVVQNFNYGSACTTDGIDCAAYMENGSQTGYQSSCTGSNCETSNPGDGEGWNSGNYGTPVGDNTSEALWLNTWRTANGANSVVFNLYGTYLINMPGGIQYSLFWSSIGPYANQYSVALYTGNVVSDKVYTFTSSPFYNAYAYPWRFTTDGDPANVASTQNQNFTVLNLF